MTQPNEHPDLLSVDEAIGRLVELVSIRLQPPGRTAGTGAVAPSVPVLFPAPEAAAMCGVSARTWRTWDAGGLVPRPVAIGRSKFWRTDEIRQWVARGCPKREVWDAEIDGEYA